jgi:hypothetical protein
LEPFLFRLLHQVVKSGIAEAGRIVGFSHNGHSARYPTDPVNETDLTGDMASSFRPISLKELEDLIGKDGVHALKKVLTDYGSKVDLFWKKGDSSREFYVKGKGLPDDTQDPTGIFPEDFFVE